jgi:hypothetical protein
MQAVYCVPECNLAELESRIEKLNRRAVKLGCSPIVVTKAADHVRYEVRQLTANSDSSRRWRKDVAKIACQSGRKRHWWSTGPKRRGRLSGPLRKQQRHCSRTRHTAA